MFCSWNMGYLLQQGVNPKCTYQGITIEECVTVDRTEVGSGTKFDVVFHGH